MNNNTPIQKYAKFTRGGVERGFLHKPEQDKIGEAIEDILKDLEYYASSEMVVEEQGLLFRINPDYAKEKAERILSLFQKEIRKAREADEKQ